MKPVRRNANFSGNTESQKKLQTPTILLTKSIKPCLSSAASASSAPRFVRKRSIPQPCFWRCGVKRVRLSRSRLPEHAGMLAFERRGTSKRYTYYAIPAGCDTVFFPGCNLPGSRPDKTFKLYEHLKKSIPTLGIVLDCCMKISHDLGRTGPFRGHVPGDEDISSPEMAFET